jgi:hypothetical protein
VHALPFAFDEFIEKLKNDSLYLITDDFAMQYERTHLYIVLWTKLYRKKAWREEELAKLQQLRQDTHSIPVAIGLIHQSIMMRTDDEAIHIIHSIKEEAAPYMLFWLEMLKAGRDWKRMGPFVEAFATLLRAYLYQLDDSYSRMDFTRWALKAISDYCILNQKIELYEKMLIATLPYSYRIYDDYLFEHQYYEKWSDLQAYIGLDIGSIASDKIKVLQKEDPHVLLPLYHQSIQGHINMKNRGNYREAVKQLKKLRTLYKKLKRQEEFQQFIDTLLDRTKRLRAFRQECERGKLIHA